MHEGLVTSAIEAVNDHNPETLDKNTALFFRMNIQHLIEIIRGGDIPAALQFARTELSSLGGENPELLDKLEEAMGLLAFQDRDTFVVFFIGVLTVSDALLRNCCHPSIVSTLRLWSMMPFSRLR